MYMYRRVKMEFTSWMAQMNEQTRRMQEEEKLKVDKARVVYRKMAAWQCLRTVYALDQLLLCTTVVLCTVICGTLPSDIQHQYERQSRPVGGWGRPGTVPGLSTWKKREFNCQTGRHNEVA